MNIQNLGVIQVRSDSSRLPNKAMLDLGGIPLIGLMLKRLQYSRLIDKIVVATTNLKTDDVLTSYLKKSGFYVFRGSVNDVLNRVYEASKIFSPYSVIRLTGDCPMIDPNLIDDLITLFHEKRADYANLDKNFAEGLDVEIIRFNALKICNKEAKLYSEREHITQYIIKNKNRFKLISLRNEFDESNLRIVVDEQEDYLLVKEIADYFSKRFFGYNYTYSDIRNFLYNNFDIVKLNSKIIRNEGLLKSLQNDYILKT